jgi:3-phosphoshikimate 1-carboxyvinyltransferase
MTSARFEPSGPLRGALRPPPDKSISHRAALLAAMGDGRSRISNYLAAEDTTATLRAIAALGARYDADRRDDRALDVVVEGVGLRGPGPAEIDVGNAGTLLRVLPGWLAGQAGGEWTLDGDDSIRRRPVDRVADPLRLMGAEVECREDRFPPLRVSGAELDGVEYRLPVASAQVKSCVLLAGLLADGETAVTEPAPSRDHTELMLEAAGAPLEIEPTGSLATARTPMPQRITVRRVAGLPARSWDVPGDFSSASFLIAAALLVPGSELRLERVGINPTRIGLLGIATRMGAAIEVEEEPGTGPEPLGAVIVRHSALQGTRIGPAEVPLAIDELPLVGLLGCFADGETIVTGAEELRHKESDRIAALVDALRGLGAEAERLPDGFAVKGTGTLRGGALETRGDHRIALLGAIAGLASGEGVEVRGFDAAAISYPGFEADLRSLLDERRADR